VPQIGGIKPPPEFGRQGLPQLRQQALAIGRPLRTALLKLHDVLPDVPIGVHLHHIYHP